MTIRAVIFDRDGVLTEFDMVAAAAFLCPLLGISLAELAVHFEAWGQQHGFPTTVAGERTFWRGLWDKLTIDLGLSEETRQMLHRFNYTTMIRPFPDARPALQVARHHGLHTAVLSNFALASLEESLVAAGLIELVDVTAAATVIGVAKPQAAAYLHVIDRLRVTPAECLFFDDEPPCVAGARALGMRAYLVDRRRADHDLAQGIVCDLSVLALLSR